MNILIAPNNYYVMPGLALLQSLFDNEKETLDIYVLYAGLTEDNIELISNLVKKNGGNLHFIEIPDGIFDNAPTSIHITKETYYRLMAHTLLPKELHKILYLDLDIVTVSSLKALYDQDFKDHGTDCYFVVCEGPGVSKREWTVYENLNIPKGYPYFNAGVLLMNLDLLRSEVAPDLMINYIAEHSDVLKYHDQDTLNALFYDRVKYVDWHIFNQTILHIKDKQEADERLKNAALIHYAGSDKPWNYNYSSWYFSLFWKYADRAGLKKLKYKTYIKRFFWHIKNKLHK